MRKVLLLDYDYTLYPPTLGTLKAVDERINLYIRTFLGYSPEDADIFRLQLWEKHGTTLKGLEERHGVEREHYCDFIHDIDDVHLPPPDPDLGAWLARLPHPTYIFTNARMDWPVRGLKAMGLESILPITGDVEKNSEFAPSNDSRLEGIFDIAFMDWEGKPHPTGYAKVEEYLHRKHGSDIEIYFADDRIDNLETAQRRNWSTIWITSLESHKRPMVTFNHIVSSLTHLDPELLE